MTDSVALLLKELRLPAFVRHYEPLWESAAEKGWSHPEYLATLCEYEIADRYQRRIQKWTREARLPLGKTFSGLALDRFSKANQGKVIKLQQDIDWSHSADNVLLMGPSGTGKTHIAAALGHALIMTQLDKYRVIIIDDIGYVRKTDAETQVLFEFIAHRYESGSLIITANQPFSEWDHIFPDSMMTVAAVDRLIHHASIIELEGESYRKAQHQASVKSGRSKKSNRPS